MSIFSGKKRIDDPNYINHELISAMDYFHINFLDLEYTVRHLHQCDTEDKESAAEEFISALRTNLRNVLSEIDKIVGTVPNIVYEDKNDAKIPVERTAAEIRNIIIFCNEIENGIGPGHKEYDGFMWDYRKTNLTRISLVKFNRDNVLLDLVNDKRSGRSWLMTNEEWSKLCCS